MTPPSPETLVTEPCCIFRTAVIKLIKNSTKLLSCLIVIGSCLLVVFLSLCCDVFYIEFKEEQTIKLYDAGSDSDLKDFPLLPIVCGARQLLINCCADTIRDGHGYQPIDSPHCNLIN